MSDKIKIILYEYSHLWNVVAAIKLYTFTSTFKREYNKIKKKNKIKQEKEEEKE
jgi:hypothetical protein